MLRCQFPLVPQIWKGEHISETAVPFYHTTRLHTLEDLILRNIFFLLFRMIWCFSDRASYYMLVSRYQINAQFLYSITIHMIHYNPQHVSSSTMLIFRGTNCIITASGIVILCKQPYCMPVESCILYSRLQKVRILEAVIIQLVLLKMSKVLLKTCSGL